MKFSIVTPTFNSERFLRETIQSVLSQQGDFTIEYIFVDNCSQDNTRAIIADFERLIDSGAYPVGCNGVTISYHREKDNSMYEAINRGFAMATGDVHAWINSDDIYLPGAFAIVARSFSRFPEVRWLKGITVYSNDSSTIYEAGRCFLYDREWLKRGVYGRDAYFVQQASVFWRADLWKRAGGIDSRFKKAGDYFLWLKFAEHAPLYSLKAYVACFRKVAGQLSEDALSYRQEYDLIPVTFRHHLLRKIIRAYFYHENKLLFPALKKFFYRMLFNQQQLHVVAITDSNQLEAKTVSYYVEP
ncbi:MAG TPA: glycosyltransferase [Desulfuromonadaceae bacterium]